MKREPLYSGKAKTVYSTDKPSVYLVEFRDSLTAFDGEKKAEVAKKGYYNAQISARLFQLLEKKGVPTHYKEMHSGNEMLVHAVEIIPLEVIPRNIAAGSLCRRYPFEEGKVLNPPVIVMDYKSDAYHDPMVNDDIALALGAVTREELEEIRKLSLQVNDILIEFMGERGLLVPDFKLEFGRLDGRVVLADEISCDTCRFWDKETGQSLDKDIFRLDKGDLLSAYEEIARRVCPEIF